MSFVTYFQNWIRISVNRMQAKPLNCVVLHKAANAFPRAAHQNYFILRKIIVAEPGR
jgi:hypothetical protein